MRVKNFVIRVEPIEVGWGDESRERVSIAQFFADESVRGETIVKEA